MLAAGIAITRVMMINPAAIAVGSETISSVTPFTVAPFTESPPTENTSTKNTSTSTTPIHPPVSSSIRDSGQGCPQEITQLAPALLADFPSYYNRTLIRSRLPGESASSTRVVLASAPEFLDAADQADFSSAAIEGFFFTTLERTYRDGQLVQQQGFYQIFLTRDVAGWLVVMTRSGYGDYPASDRITPPRDSSSGLLVQTVRTWLRDCEAR